MFEKNNDSSYNLDYKVEISCKWKNLHQLIWKIASLGRFKTYYLMDNNKIIASAEVMTKIFIFSFMTSKPAIHIGPCWTDPSYRNKGLYTNLIKRISSDYLDFDKYIFCSSDNYPSMKGIAKAGFREFAKGYKNNLGIYKVCRGDNL